MWLQNYCTMYTLYGLASWEICRQLWVKLIFRVTVMISAVVDKRLVDKIGEKTAIFRKYNMSTKILFCRHNVLFWKRKDTFKKQNIDIVKISLQKGLTAWEKRAVKRVQRQQRHASRSACHCLPGQSRWYTPNLKFGFWLEHHCIYFLTSFVDSCNRRDEIWPDMSTKKFVLDDSTSDDTCTSKI